MEAPVLTAAATPAVLITQTQGHHPHTGQGHHLRKGQNLDQNRELLINLHQSGTGQFYFIYFILFFLMIRIKHVHSNVINIKKCS